MTRSAVLWQQVRALSAGLRTGKISAAQFGVQPPRPGIVAFLEAVQEQVDTQRLPQKAEWVARGRGGAEGGGGAPGSKQGEGGGDGDKMEEG